MTDPAVPAPFVYADDPERPGWKRWALGDDTRYNAFLGPLSVRREDSVARVVMAPGRQHSNLRDQVHGGAVAGFADVALFAASRAFGVLHEGGSSTIDMSVQFVAGAAMDRELEARVELLRATGRFLFLRGLMVQGETIVASFSGTVRKAGR